MSKLPHGAIRLSETKKLLAEELKQARGSKRDNSGKFKKGKPTAKRQADSEGERLPSSPGRFML